jgi:hypothetical protein
MFAAGGEWALSGNGNNGEEISEEYDVHKE